MGQLWVLYDPTKETQSSKLTTEETQFAILRLKTKYVNQYLIWREDWAKWKKLNAFLESQESPFMNMPQAFSNDTEVNKSSDQAVKMSPAHPDIIQKVKTSFEFSSVNTGEMNLRDAIGKKEQAFDGDEFAESTKTQSQNKTDLSLQFDFKSLNKSNAFGKRTLEDQFKIELLFIHSNGQMFRTPAQGISLSGTFTEKVVPGEYHNGVFDLVVINNMINDNQYNRVNLKASVLLTDSRIYIQFINTTEEQKKSLRSSLDYYVRAQKKITD